MTVPFTPRVTVLMPVYNGARFVRPAIESVLNQTFADFEFLLIDDGSTDDSSSIIRSYDDPRIRLVQNEKNLRVVATLNRGLAQARSEYIARMDADDVSCPERLERQVAFLDANPRVGIVGTAVEGIDADGASLGAHYYPTEPPIVAWRLLFFPSWHTRRF